MPRKNYRPTNRYVRKSRLGEFDYFRMIALFLHGLTFEKINELLPTETPGIDDLIKGTFELGNQIDVTCKKNITITPESISKNIHELASWFIFSKARIQLCGSPPPDETLESPPTEREKRIFLVDENRFHQRLTYLLCRKDPRYFIYWHFEEIYSLIEIPDDYQEYRKVNIPPPEVLEPSWKVSLWRERQKKFNGITPPQMLPHILFKALTEYSVKLADINNMKWSNITDISYISVMNALKNVFTHGPIERSLLYKINPQDYYSYKALNISLWEYSSEILPKYRNRKSDDIDMILNLFTDNIVQDKWYSDYYL